MALVSNRQGGFRCILVVHCSCQAHSIVDSVFALPFQREVTSTSHSVGVVVHVAKFCEVEIPWKAMNHGF